ncbi:MAG: hypothetical protein OEY14_07550 [Myxococcales bacterium]|nr:hypothetical protein [Myxococcales bacterium]
MRGDRRGSRPRSAARLGLMLLGTIGLASLLLASACREIADRQTPSRAETAAVLDEEARRREEEPDEPDESDELLLDQEPLPSSGSVDSMSREQLEAACWSGSQAACDQLGH